MAFVLILAAILRKLTSILLLAFLCFSLTGYHLFFRVQIANAKSEMFAFLKKQQHHKDVIELCFENKEASQLDWENNQEFTYNHQMYDLIEKKTDGDKLILRCIADKHETELVNEYQKNSRQNQSNELVVQLITASFILPETPSINQFASNLKNQYFSYSSPLQVISSSVVAPPPDVC